MSLQAELCARRASAEPAYLDQIADAARQLELWGVPARAKRVGDRAPDFALSTADGRVVVLSELLRDGPIVMSFFRGEWCSFCRAELDALLASQPDMARLGASLVLVSPEPASAKLIGEVATLGPSAYLLRDPMLGVALQYGLVYLVPESLRMFYLARQFDLSRELSTGSWLLPIPADFIVGANGVISLSYLESDFTRRLDPKILVEELQRGRLSC
ncbi:peroxiredoxin-like family protein [Lichenifustis flavocetrariae]|uniref:AhpC/TSA family protein n=1 Tax=Lichenifustis flavocetrariae TaxID=2949735 RepID=A0AA41YZP8_9HYPH|nr:peroxiredoxin-like family protein [Lichenifustis flavocetrariae]MCW6511541.1 AhpC/TSA family protein [Lichenifustis flavocetrariae]